ncbi:MAG: glutaredoxin 3 [Deltaproteobacteria bacterium]|nr:glutaredoxin 3 [Deltaproteobacteria bacterium]
MRSVKIYTTSYCGFCDAAKRLMKERGIPFEEIDVEGDDPKRAWLVRATGRRTVPQIFIGDEPIGGYTDLVSLDKSGELSRKLSEPSIA